MAKNAQGVVAVFTDPSGHVAASVSDFRPDTYGGFKKAEAQEHRARVAIAHEVVRVYCSDLIVKAMGSYECEQLLRKLTGEMKCTVSYVRVGYDEE